MPSVSAHVAQTLSAHLSHVYGVMGNGNAYFLDALIRDTDIEYAPVRHEAGAVFAADAHFRAGGGIAAATTTYGAGFTNTMTALAEAVQARIPLLLVVGDEPTSGPRPWDVDQIAMASAVGARTYTVGRTDAAATTSIAVEHALRFNVPTVLAIPYDVARLDAGPVPQTTTVRPVPPLAPAGEFAEATLEGIAAALAGAQRPFLLAGRGAWLSEAGDALGELADLTHAVTASSALGRGLFPRGEFDLGVAGGFGAPAAMELVREADVAVVFGAGLNQFTMRFGALFAPGTRVIQVDLSPTATHPHVGTFVRGDARIVATDLVKRLQARGLDGGGTGWREAQDYAALTAREVPDERAQDGRLDPRAVAAAIAPLLPQDRVVVSDGGHFLGWANMYWPIAQPDRMLMVGTAYQTIGTGFSSMPGAADAKPDSTVVLSSGDGGGLMALADLETAVRHCRGRGLAVIWNDAAYGAEVNLYGVLGLERSPMLIDQVDFAALTEALGGRGVVVTQLADLDALAAWRDEDPSTRPFLTLDLRISAEVIAPHQYEVIEQNR